MLVESLWSKSRILECFFALILVAYGSLAQATTVRVSGSDNLQAKLNAAKPGDVFLLQAGATFTHVTIPKIAAASPTNPITVRTSTADGVFPGATTRISPSNVSLMPAITQDDVNTVPGIQFADGAHDWIFMGIEVKRSTNLNPDTHGSNIALVLVGNYAATTLAQLPSNITFDRCYIHGNPRDQTKRGMWINGIMTTIKNSYISEIHSSGADSQAMLFSNGPGQYRIDNNYIESAGENILVGGTDPIVPGVHPEHFTWTRNTFAKQLSWKVDDPSYIAPYSGNAYSVKNLFELKAGAYMLVEGNIFEYNWAKSQTGSGILITVFQNQKGAECFGCLSNVAPQNWTHDITFRNNIIRHTASVFVIKGRDEAIAPVNQQNITKNITITNNLIYDVSKVRWNPSGDDTTSGNHLIEAPAGPDTITFTHNTYYSNESPQSGKIYYDTGVPGQHYATNLVVKDNILSHGVFSVSGNGTSTAHSALDEITGVVFQNNVIVGLTTAGQGVDASYWGSYFGTNLFPSPDTWGKVGFVNLTNYTDFHLSNASPYKAAATDGTDIGANIDAIRAAQSAVPVVSLPSPAPPQAAPLAPPPPAPQPVSTALLVQPASPSSPTVLSPPPAPSSGLWSGLIQVTGTTSFGDPSYTITVPGISKMSWSAAQHELTTFQVTGGLFAYYDLKNDPSALLNLSHPEHGFFPDAYGVQGGLDPHYEYKSFGGTMVLAEANAIRVKLIWTGTPYTFGSPKGIRSRDVSFSQTMVMYAPDKIYKTHTLTNVNPNKTMVSIAGAGFQLDLQNSWWRFDRELGDVGCRKEYVTTQPIPSTWVNQNADGTNAHASYMLHVGSPGVTSDYNGPTNKCTTPISNPKTYTGLVQNYLLIAKDLTGAYVYRGQDFMGMRSKIEFPAQNLVTGASVTYYSVAHFGDNGITSRVIADVYNLEYAHLVAPTITTGTLNAGANITNGFDYRNGAYSMIAGTSGMDFVTHQTQHYPVFQVAGWPTAVPSTIKVNGTTKTLNTDYSALKLDTTTLLLQYRSVVGDATRFQIQ